jgi:carbon-monoxide dehydrogenase medium subunit
MIISNFEFEEPHSIAEACAILHQNPEKIKIIAGGTDLLVNMKKRLLKPERLVSLDKIAGLRGISSSEAGGLKMGPLATMTEIAGSKVITEKYPALSDAASKLGTPQIRSRATVGGNICTARPAADTLGPLMGYGAAVTLVSATGERRVLLDSFFTGPGQTVMRPDEILTEITLPPTIPKTGSCYIKFGIRRAAEIAVVSVTSVVALDPRSDECRSARVVLGAVAPTFILCPASEKVLLGKRITEELAAQAGTVSAQICLPISDLRGSEDYRRMLVEVLTKRTLLEASRLAAV